MSEPLRRLLERAIVALFGTQNQHRRRFTVALAIAVAVHEIIAGIIPAGFHEPAAPAQVQTALIERLRLERPIPPPTPKPTPRPIVRVHRLAPVAVHTTVNPGVMSPNQHVKRRASRSPRVISHYHHAISRRHLVMGGHGISTSRAKADVGGVGAGGNGSGSGKNGNGLGGPPAASEPCGFVEFVATDSSATFDAKTGLYYVNIKMIVHFPDGSSQDVRLDYPWSYPSEAADPWSAQNAGDPNFKVTFQQPPPAQAPDEPPLVQYVMAHSTKDGYTLLKNCPG